MSDDAGQEDAGRQPTFRRTLSVYREALAGVGIRLGDRPCEHCEVEGCARYLVALPERRMIAEVFVDERSSRIRSVSVHALNPADMAEAQSQARSVLLLIVPVFSPTKLLEATELLIEMCKGLVRRSVESGNLNQLEVVTWVDEKARLSFRVEGRPVPVITVMAEALSPEEVSASSAG